MAVAPRPADTEAPPRHPRVVEQLDPDDHAITTGEGPNAEACRQVAVRVRAALEKHGASTLAVVSALPGEGKTTVACDLALALASLSSGRSVALVDLDLRRSSLGRVLGIEPELGVEDVLRGKAALDDACVQLVQPSLDVYPVALIQPASHELLALPAFAAMVHELKRRYAVVLFDTPPTLLLPDTSLILRSVDACLPIASAGQTRARHFRAMIEALPKRQILGQLLNGVRASRASYDEYYYSKAHVGSKGDDEERPTGGDPAA